MSSAGEGEDSRLRIGGWLPESEVEPGDGSPENAVTQLVPVLNADASPPPYEATQLPADAIGTQRGVAQRAPAPLPNLGSDNAPDVDVPRRKRRQAKPADTPRPEATPDGEPEPRSTPAVLPEPEDATRAAVEVAAAHHESAARAEEQSRESADGVPVTPTLEEEVLSRTDLSAIEADALKLPTVRRVVGDIDADHQRVVALHAQSTLAATTARPGPTVLAADTWEFDQDVGFADEKYHGRRRAQAPAARLWIAISAVLIGLGAAVAIPLAVTSSPREGAVAPPTAPPSAGPIEQAPPGTEKSLSAASSPVPTPSPSPSAPKQTPSRSAKANPVPPPPPPSPAPPQPSPPPPPPPFEPLSVEAENATMGGSAVNSAFADASGGLIVQHMGNWGLPDGPGTLTFSDVEVPTDGTYTLTIYFVHPNGEEVRNAVITVSDADSTEVAFVGGSTCCYTQAVDITLTVGAQTITISNEVGHAPAIDKIVLSGP